MKVKMRTTHRVELPSYLHCCGRGFDTASSRTQRESAEVIYENHEDKLLREQTPENQKISEQNTVRSKVRIKTSGERGNFTLRHTEAME